MGSVNFILHNSRRSPTNPTTGDVREMCGRCTGDIQIQLIFSCNILEDLLQITLSEICRRFAGDVRVKLIFSCYILEDLQQITLWEICGRCVGSVNFNLQYSRGSPTNHTIGDTREMCRFS